MSGSLTGPADPDRKFGNLAMIFVPVPSGGAKSLVAAIVCALRSRARSPKAIQFSGALHVGRSQRARHERRHSRGVAPIGVSKGRDCLALFGPGKPYVHPHQDREHGECKERGPLQQKAEHDQDEAYVLGMADIGVGPRSRQNSLALGLRIVPSTLPK